MDALFSSGGQWWSSIILSQSLSHRRRFRSPESKASDAVDRQGFSGGGGFNFPLKQAAIAASLALAGDTIAQISSRWKLLPSSDVDPKGASTLSDVLSDHDWLRALRMTSYGFLLYGPGSYAWYQFLDHSLPNPTFRNLSLKVLLNQIVLGPCVIAIVFAWNNLWVGKLAELPKKYSRDALPALLFGCRFWTPVSVLNFWVVPLQARVAYMSTCSIFWNFYLSSSMSK